MKQNTNITSTTKTNIINTQAAGEGNKNAGTAPPRKAPESKVTAEKTETSRNQ